MLFNSLSYAIFLPIVFFAYWLMPHKYRWIVLLVTSYYFYMSWNPKYIILILLTTIVSYIAGIMLEKYHNKKARRLILASVLVICLGILFFFKYFNFFELSIISFLQTFAIKLQPQLLTLLLPVGISFYTFQTLSYVIDVYRGDIPAEHHFGMYATFISFFPQLVAGPIERTKNLLPQIKSEKVFNYESASYGIKLMAWGFFKKLAIADVVAVYVDAGWSSLDKLCGLDFLFIIFFFSIQIYCDFSGYSDIAIGTANMLGIRLMTNFKSPYFSQSVKEFWSRWHISLSTWFRDYVYIPLGGNRCSKCRKNINTMLTFLASGLWHGANWTFVIWGGIHGFMQVIENLLVTKKSYSGRIQKIIATLLIFVFCNVAWIFFRAESLHDAFYVISHTILSFGDMGSFFGSHIGLSKIKLMELGYTIGLLTIFDFISLKQNVILLVSKQNFVVRWSIYLILIWSILMMMPTSGTTEFVYFQF